MVFSIQKWFRIVLFNLLLIAFIGFILRYKIAFSLPFVDQKHLLQAHSHFAFCGWISQALMVLMVAFLSQRGVQHAFEKYHRLLLLNLISAYGMLLCFPLQGYGLFSISFSTLSILTAYTFAYLFWKDLNNCTSKEIASWWFKAALLFNALSSIGAFSLAYLMANKIIHQNWYLLAVYFFLHFQYNGWFFFAIGGLWFAKIRSLEIHFSKERTIFLLFAIACIPCYFLSTLWFKMGKVIYSGVLIAAILQIVALALLLKAVYKNRREFKTKLLKISSSLFALSLLAFSIKLLLQVFSTIPSLNQLAYGFRPIVIGYLHLVLLGFISLSIIAFAIANNFLVSNKIMLKGIVVFVLGIIINEILLLLQGTSSMLLVTIPLNNEMLLGAAFIMFSGVLILFYSQFQKARW